MNTYIFESESFEQYFSEFICFSMCEMFTEVELVTMAFEGLFARRTPDDWVVVKTDFDLLDEAELERRFGSMPDNDWHYEL